MRPALLLLPALLAVGCDAEFEVDRDEIADRFRVLGVGVHDGVATAALWSGEGPWHSEAPELTWLLDGDELGQGWDVQVPDVGEELELVAVSGSGAEVRAVLPLVDTDDPVLRVQREAVELGGDYRLEARRAVEGTPVDTRFPVDQDKRLRLTEEDGEALADDLRVTWATTAPSGTLLSVDEVTTDLVAPDLTWDDEAWIPDEDAEPGVFAGVPWRHLVFGLVRDGAGHNRWSWVELAEEDEAESWALTHHEGLLVPALPQEDAELVLGELSWDAATGVSFTPLDVALNLVDHDPPECGEWNQPFRLAWVIEGRCAGPDVDGHTVVIETW